MFVCPNAIVPKSIGVISSVSFIIPAASPGKSIPVTFPNPSFSIYSFKVSAPSLSPKVINPTLQEFFNISDKV